MPAVRFYLSVRDRWLPFRRGKHFHILAVDRSAIPARESLVLFVSYKVQAQLSFGRHVELCMPPMFLLDRYRGGSGIVLVFTLPSGFPEGVPLVGSLFLL